MEQQTLRDTAEAYGQGHVFRFWEHLNEHGRAELTAQLAQVDFALMRRLADQWILSQPSPEHFQRIDPVTVIPVDAPDAREAWDAGEEALHAGRAGLFLVAGGQGTRLGFSGPKGAYPIGPITGKTLFAYHAEKIHNLQRRYSCVLPWYIMVSDSNAAATEAHFAANGYFGLARGNVRFLRQRAVPCMDAQGRFMLDAPSRLAMNPNGHGGCIPAMVESGVLDDARNRGVDLLSYFQVDNWAIKAADPRFIGYHVLRGAEMSSKNHRKSHVREAVGVHCLCDGEYRVIEYSELDIYPQLLETDASGQIRYYAGNPAIHIISTGFVQRVYDIFGQFPWHLAHKRIPYINETGERVQPSAPNGYKFETFVFDALRFVKHPPVAVGIEREGEYTPTKQFEGDNSVVAARRSMASLWSKWLDAAGSPVPRDANGACAIQVEISPRFAWSLEEFVARSAGKRWPVDADLAIGPDGDIESATSAEA